MKVKLVKGLSYYQISTGLSAKKDQPITVNDEVGAELISTGRFAEVKEDEKLVAPTPAPTQASNGAITTDSFKKPKPLPKMNTEELEAYAKEKGIDLSGCEKNADRIAAITAAEEAEKASAPAQDTDGATPGFAE